MPLIDTHTHLYLSQFDHDRQKVVDRARDAGVGWMLLPNIDSHTAGPLMQVCRQYPSSCLPMMGLHPTSVKASYRTELELIGGWLKKERFVAVGETGIDLYWDTNFAREQRECLEQHLQWAIEYELPLVFHSRNSLKELFDVLQAYRQEGLQGVFHCFPGNADEAKTVVDMGFMLGIGGVVTYKNSQMASVVQSVGLEHLVLETDAPYLSPVPHRGKRNESAFLRHVADKVAEIRGVDPEEVAAVTTANATRLFGISDFLGISE